MSQWNDPYGQPQYGQPQYGQPQYGQPPQRQNPFGPHGNESFGIVGTVLGLLGGVILIVSFTSVDWFTKTLGTPSFGDLSDYVSNSNAPGFAEAYFSWLAWAFLIVVVLSAVLTSFPNPALRALRIIGAVIGFAAAGLTFLAIKLDELVPYTNYLKHTSLGFYMAVGGFILAGIGCAIGPRKV